MYYLQNIYINYQKLAVSTKHQMKEKLTIITAVMISLFLVFATVSGSPSSEESCISISAYLESLCS